MKNVKPLDHLILILGILFLLLPIWIAFASSTHRPETLLGEGLQLWFGDYFWETYSAVLFENTGFTEQVNAVLMLQNSMVLGLGFSIGKIIISTLAAYAIVYFRFPAGSFFFWIIFSSLLLPLEVRIIPSYEVVSDLGMLNSYTGLILPLIASATATFFFRQFYKSVPEEILEAARIDGAGPFRFFVDILLPLSKTMIAAIFIIMFVVGWNQYLWPILMTTDESYFTVVMGIKQILNDLEGNRIPQYNKALALSILALLPPVMVVVIFQRWFVKGLVESEK
ncbi:sn-glycerol-3-phosphate ABC transporter permease UgpE [Nisaea acidiphila]|uniref:sn-glycerol-3-phosphate transport system permease protein UgpE n=1 Tax=Nisaea acidiphila TaxID=1862145 RepID=A0A9J7AZ68_9PROT|nr:sn-glycerol-3-phosphate ABC transporter permease UgpE [Nisaea acidiphila]UUX52074.1 sn-glycerol-3-phosphate ABC transporter permease UgpE [Nisaea acidiphila]